MGSCGGWKRPQGQISSSCRAPSPGPLPEASPRDVHSFPSGGDGHHPLRHLTRATNSPVMSGAQRAARRDRRDQANYFDLLGAAVPSSYYEIRVAGVLPPEALLDFERLTASVEPVETVVHGPLRDQAALHGLLARLETFGVQVLEVRRLYERDPPASEASGD